MTGIQKDLPSKSPSTVTRDAFSGYYIKNQTE